MTINQSNIISIISCSNNKTCGTAQSIGQYIIATLVVLHCLALDMSFARNINDDDSDDAFIDRVISSGGREIPIIEFQRHADVLPKLSQVVQARMDDSVMRAVVEAYAVIAIDGDFLAAKITRAELLKLAESERLARMALADMDVNAKKWLGSNAELTGTYPDCDVVIHSHDELDVKKLTYLRMLRDRSPEEILNASRPSRARNPWEDWESGPNALCLIDVNFKDADLQYIAGLSNIVRLELCGTQVTGSGLKNLHLPKLELLHLAKCPVSDETAQLIDIPSLRLLDLAETKISDAALATIKAADIEGLWLMSTNITADGLAHLARFDKLEHLRIDGKIIDDKAIENLKKCTNLKVVTLYGELTLEMTQEKMQAMLPKCLFRFEAGLE